MFRLSDIPVGNIVNGIIEYEQSTKHANLYRPHCTEPLCGWRAAGYANMWVAETWAEAHVRGEHDDD